MRILGFNAVTNTLKLIPETFDDLYLLARIIWEGDDAESKTYRRFRPSEGEEGEQKEVWIKIAVEKIEIDKNAGRLRLAGRILGGRPAEYIATGSHHTLNIAAGHPLEIRKDEWKGYVRDMIKQAVQDSKKPSLGIVAMDEEKATFAYVKGYGIDIITELYSRLNKRMASKDYEKERQKYFSEIVKKVQSMRVDLIIMAGPGFTKDDLKKYMEENRVNLGKKTAYVRAYDTERSGIREALQSSEVSKLLESEKIRKEFEYLNLFLRGLSVGASFHGVDAIRKALETYNVAIMIVNDSVISDSRIRNLLDSAYRQKVEIKIFNADDDAGMQLKNFSGIAAIGKQLLRQAG